MDNGPPSSVNVARALASLRASELMRVEELVQADDAQEQQRLLAASLATSPADPRASLPTISIGKEIFFSELARRMDQAPQELGATLVARGFYSLRPKTLLSHDTARVIAESFGWRVEAAIEDTATGKPTKRASSSKKGTER
jgi:hypothetical protein